MIKMTDPPVDLNTVRIETARLCIRAINPADTTDIFLNLTPTVTAYMNLRPATYRYETAAFVDESMRALRDHTALTATILDKATGVFLGCLGLHELHTASPELGIWLKQTVHGQGYGREAIHAGKQWADAWLDYDYLRYPVDERNTASWRLAESLGGQIARYYPAKGGLSQELILREYRIDG